MPLASRLTDEFDELEQLAGPFDAVLTGVSIAEHIDQIADCADGTVVVLTAAATSGAAGYALDVALRRASLIAGLVVQHSFGALSLTARSIAERRQLNVWRLREPVNLADFAIRVSLIIDEGVPLALERARRVSLEVARAEAAGLGVDAILDAARSVLGTEIHVSDDRTTGAPTDVTSWDGRWLSIDSTAPGEQAINELLEWRIAAATTKRFAEHERAEHLSSASAAHVISRILDTAFPITAGVEHRALGLGIDIDAWHVVTRLDFTNLLLLHHGDALQAHEVNDRVCDAAGQALRKQPAAPWHLVPQVGGALLLRSRSRPTGPDDMRTIATELDKMLSAVRSVEPDLAVNCGVGAGHQGPAGMRASAAEAQIALYSSRKEFPEGGIHFYDAPGLRRLLVEWYASPSVQDNVDDLLAPIAELGNQPKQDEFLQTLRVFLDFNQSTKRTAEELVLHRNTVTYRINRVLEVLDVDIDDPAQRLALHLATRAHSIKGT